MLNRSVNLLAKGDMAVLTTMLRESGYRHYQYGVVVEHFPVVGTALITTLRTGLGADFTKEAEESWTALYDVVQKTMIEGIQAAEADAKAGVLA